MKRFPLPIQGALALALFTCAGLTSAAADRTAKEILKDLDKSPAMSTSEVKDQASFNKFRETVTARGKLIDELFKLDPQNKELEKLLKERWEFAGMTPDGMKVAEKQTEWAIKESKSEPLLVEALYFKARASLGGPGATELPKALKDFLAKAPKDDDRAPQLLYMASMRLGKDAKKGVCEQILADYPKFALCRDGQG